MSDSETRDPRGYVDQVLCVARAVDPDAVQRLSDALFLAYCESRLVFIIGNGGSAANASHLCEDLGKGTLCDLKNQKRLKVLSLTDNTPYLLAWANDTSFACVFEEQLRNLASPGDLLIAISGSGNSQNILQAVAFANAHGMHTFGVTGFDGGQLRRLARDCLHVPCADMGVVEAVHAIFFHFLTEDLRLRFARYWRDGSALTSQTRDREGRTS